MMLVQLSLNVFGAMDILPFTGVTFPFVSHGGTSLISCWAMLAFIKGADIRAGASFAVKRPEKFTGGAGVEEEPAETGILPPEPDAPPLDAPDGGIDWQREDPPASAY